MPSNLVVLLHIAGNALACVRDGEAVRVRAIRKSTAKPAGQAEALALLRPGGHSGGFLFAGNQHVGPLEQAMRHGLDLAGGLDGGHPASTCPAANARLGYIKHQSRAPLASGPLAEVIEVRHGGKPCTFCKALQAPGSVMCNPSWCEP